jgi:predicted permease
VALLSLALGIGANTAIFSVINGVLLKFLPVRDPQDLRVIGWTGENVPAGGLTSDSLGISKSGELFRMSFPYPLYRDFAEAAEGFSHVFAFSYAEEGLRVGTGGGPAIVAHGLMVSGGFFDGYGARVLIGRPITPEDDRVGADPVGVITHRFWRRHYDLDPRVLGRTLIVNDVAFTIVGVLPQRFRGPLSGDPSEFYLPITAQPRVLAQDDDQLVRSDRWWVRVMGRLAPGANEARARALLAALFNRALPAATPGADRPAILLEDGGRGLSTSQSHFHIAAILMFLQMLVGVVLLIACANVAGLLLARGAARRHEMSLRAAIGAGRWRLIRQSLAESLLLSLGASALGLALSVCITAVATGPVTDLLRRMQPDLDYMGDRSARINLAQGIDARVLLFTLAIGLSTTLLFGLLPALRASRVDPAGELKDGTGRGAPRLRLGRAMVVTQVALSMLLVTGAVLLTRTVVHLRRIDPGYDVENLLVFRLNLAGSVQETRDPTGLFDEMRAGIAAIPGVRSVALSRVEGGWFTDVSVPGRPDDDPEVATCIVSDGWFATMGIALLAGRDFTPADVARSPRVAIVNEAFGREYFPDEYLLGKWLQTESGQYEIVGLCANHKLDLRGEAPPLIYFCTRQEPGRRMGFTVRSVLSPLSLAPAVRRAVAAIDPALPLEGLSTKRLLLKESLAMERTLTGLCVSLAALALGLSCIGLYGLMAYDVAHRRGEIGIRMALGARPVDVARPILCRAGALAVAGAAIGAFFAFAMATILGSIVFGFARYDLASMVAAGLILFAVAIAAAWIPARRAARVDPMVALRYE